MGVSQQTNQYDITERHTTSLSLCHFFGLANKQTEILKHLQLGRMDLLYWIWQPALFGFLSFY